MSAMHPATGAGRELSLLPAAASLLRASMLIPPAGRRGIGASVAGAAEALRPAWLSEYGVTLSSENG